MELNDSHLPALSDYLEKTLSPDVQVRKPAEGFLQGLEKERGYPLLLLMLLNPDHGIPYLTQKLQVKNYIINLVLPNQI